MDPNVSPLTFRGEKPNGPFFILLFQRTTHTDEAKKKRPVPFVFHSEHGVIVQRDPTKLTVVLSHFETKKH